MATICLLVTVVYNSVLKMFPNSFSVFLTLVITINVIKGDFVSINWNASTDRKNSHLERDYKYPMYHKVSPAPCDLTDSCDVFCCQDPDCDAVQKQSFQCSETEDNTLPYFDCNSDYYDKPEWMSWFCYVFKNPLYLGKFYTTPSKIEKIGVLRNEIGNKAKNFGNSEVSKPKTELKFGSPVMTYSPMANLFPSVGPLMMKIPIQASSQACILTPVKYRLKGVTTCLKKVTPELCENDQTLGILPFLIQNTTMTSYKKTPIVLKSLDSLEGIETEVQIKCIKPKLLIHKSKNGKLHYIFQKDSVCEELISTYQTVWNKPVCENVLAYVHHHFTVNGSDLIKLRVEYGVMNLSLPSEIVNEFSASLFHQYIYTKQVFNISFHDIMNSIHSNQNSSENDQYSRGYFVGEQLNFGYKSFENSSAIWKKRFIGVFKSKQSCENLSPVKFGFDTFSTCKILMKFSNCTQLQNEIEKNFDNLLQGDSIAAYSNLRPPYNATIPLLRNYPQRLKGDLRNSSYCSVPMLQDLLIQYTTLVTKNGVSIHKIIGVRVDRSYQNVNLVEDLLLTSRVLHFYVSSSVDKPMSRFWTRMFSPELSENSWLNIFKAFEDVNAVEQEQITFWSIFLTISVTAVIAFTKHDFNLAVSTFPADNPAPAETTH